MNVEDVMSEDVVTVQTDDSLATAITRMVDKSVSGLPVLDGTGILVGILSEGDLLRRVELGTVASPQWFTEMFRPGHQAKVYARTHGCLVHHIMTRTPCTVAATATLDEAVRFMEERRVKRLPVIKEERLVGIITRADFVKALASLVSAPYEEPATCDEEIRTAVLAEVKHHSWAEATAVEVVVRDRVVTLSGGITDERQRGALQAAAGTVVGVRSVDASQLRLGRSADLPDSVIAHAENW